MGPVRQRRRHVLHRLPGTREGVMVWATDLPRRRRRLHRRHDHDDHDDHDHDHARHDAHADRDDTTDRSGTVGRATPVVTERSPTPPVVRVPTCSGSSTPSRRFTTGDVGGDSSAVWLVVESNGLVPADDRRRGSQFVGGVTDECGRLHRDGSVRSNSKPTTAYSIAATDAPAPSLGAGRPAPSRWRSLREVGVRSGSLSFDLSDGTVVGASLLGDGSAEPTLGPGARVAAPARSSRCSVGIPGRSRGAVRRSGTSEVDR